MEIELRAKVKNQELLEQKINELENIKEIKSRDRQVDIYLKHEKDDERKLVIRLRKNYETKNAILTFKAKSLLKEDIAWLDFDTKIEDPDILENILVNSGYVYVCIIDKLRQSFKYKEFVINIDNVRDLGLFVEIEKRGVEENIEMIKKEIVDLLKFIGVKENDIINRGYVQLMIDN